MSYGSATPSNSLTLRVRSVDRIFLAGPWVFPARIVELVTDGPYASKAWRGPPERIMVKTWVRANARAHKLAAVERRTGQQGAPRSRVRRCRRCRSPASELHAGHNHRPERAPADRARPRVRVPVVRAVLLTHARSRSILIRNLGHSEGFDVALASTDAEVSAPALIAR